MPSIKPIQWHWPDLFSAMMALVAGLVLGFGAIVVSSISSPSILILMAIVFLGIVIVPAIFEMMNHRFDPFETKNVFLLFYTLNSLSVPIRALFITPESVEFGYIVKALGLCLAGLIAFQFGYSLRRTLKPPSERISFIPLDWSLPRVKVISRVFIVGGIAIFLGTLAFTVGIRTYFVAGYDGRAILKAQLGPLEFGLYVCLIGILLYWSYFLILRRWPSPLLWASIFAFGLVMSLIGIRRPTFWLLMGLISLYHYFYKRITFLRISLLAILIGGGLIIFAFTRHIVSSGDFKGGIDYAQQNFSWSWFDISRTELGAPFKSLLQIIQKVPDLTPYFMGRSYLETPLVFLPRMIMPNRPTSISGWYEQAFFSSDFVAEGGSMGVFITAEAYINFGGVGVIVILFLWGIFFKRVYDYFLKNKGNPVYVFIYASSLAWIIFLMRLDFAGAVKGYFVTALVPALLAISLTRRKARLET